MVFKSAIKAKEMKGRSLFFRALFCLPFVLSGLFIHSYHGELINNAQVTWQYVRDEQGQIYLGIDVEAPSGISIQHIRSKHKDITSSWALTNFPWWYKGEEASPSLKQFQDVLHPYLPFNKDSGCRSR